MRGRLLRHLRVSEIASLTWSQVIPRETGEVQLALVGKGDKERHVLLPAETATKLLALRGDASNSVRVFPITERRINYILKAIVKRAGGNPASRPTGCATPTPATRSTTAHRSPSSHRHSAMSI